MPIEEPREPSPEPGWGPSREPAGRAADRPFEQPPELRAAGEAHDDGPSRDEPASEPVAGLTEPVAGPTSGAVTGRFESTESGGLDRSTELGESAESGGLDGPSQPAEAAKPAGPGVDELSADAPIEERVRHHAASLDGIEHRPIGEHAQRYDEVHTELQAALTEIDGESVG